MWRHNNVNFARTNLISIAIYVGSSLFHLILIQMNDSFSSTNSLWHILIIQRFVLLAEIKKGNSKTNAFKFFEFFKKKYTKTHKYSFMPRYPHALALSWNLRRHRIHCSWHRAPTINNELQWVFSVEKSPNPQINNFQIII